MHQLEDSIVDLLQTLADMDITFKALKVNYPSILCFKSFFPFYFFSLNLYFDPLLCWEYCRRRISEGM